MRWAILLLTAALASGAGALWYLHQQLVGMQAAVSEAQASVAKLQASYTALQAAYDMRARAYEYADKQAQDKLNVLDQQAGDWGNVCLPDGIGGLFCTGSTGASADSDASGKSDAGNAGSGLDSKNQ